MPTGLITTRGARDVLEIGRQTRPHLYDYSVTKPEPLVERYMALEVTERLREAAAKGLAAGAATKEDQSKQPPELAKERTKPFEMGI